MPGRYLVIEFDDEAAATSLREQINKATRNGKKFRVVGLFARPGKPCICRFLPGDRSADRVKRGGRFGWWVCTTCGKPRFGDHELTNLIIPPEVIDPPTHFGVDPLHNKEVDDRNYIRHPIGMNVITLPNRVASAPES